MAVEACLFCIVRCNLLGSLKLKMKGKGVDIKIERSRSK